MSKSKWFPNRGVHPSLCQLPPSSKLTLQHHHQNPIAMQCFVLLSSIFQCIPLLPSNVVPSPSLHYNIIIRALLLDCAFSMYPPNCNIISEPCFWCFSNCQGAERQNKFWSYVVCQHSGSQEMPGQSQHIVFREKITQRKGRGMRRKEKRKK